MDEFWPVLKWLIAVAASGAAVVLVLLLVNLGITRLGRRTPTVLHSWLRVRRPGINFIDI